LRNTKAYYDEPSTNSYQSAGSSNFYNEQIKSQTSDFFSRKQAENLSRPEGLPPSQGGRYAGFGNTVDPPRSDDSSEFMSSLTSSISSFTLNAGKWASVAKDNLVKISSTAAQQANELSKNVNEKVKEGSLLSSLSYGVTNVSSKLGDVSTKAWSNLNTYWTGEDSSGLKTSSSSSGGFFSRGGYNSVPGENAGFYGSNDYSGYNSNDNYNNNSSNDNTANKKSNKDDWNWDDNSWESVPQSNSTTTNTSTKSTKPTSASNSTQNKKTTTKSGQGKDLINFDEDKWDNWEAIDKSN